MKRLLQSITCHDLTSHQLHLIDFCYISTRLPLLTLMNRLERRIIEDETNVTIHGIYLDLDYYYYYYSTELSLCEKQRWS